MRYEPEKILRGFLVFVLCVLGFRLFYLQVFSYDRFFQMAFENASKIISIPAPRGLIYDRNNKVLVENKAVFAVYLSPYALKENEMERVLLSLQKIMGISRAEITLALQNRKRRGFEPIKIKDFLSLDIVTRLEEEKASLPGVFIRSRPVRYYPYGKMAAHVLGYVGEIEKDELNILREKGYRLGDSIGKSGLETSYEEFLKGESGGDLINVNVYGIPIRTGDSKIPVAGKSLHLTLDLDLQLAVEEALDEQAVSSGSVVVMDPRSGEILAMASRPTFDVNLFSHPISPAQWQVLNRTRYPFMNRAIAHYPAGSIFKAITLTAVLEEKKINLKEFFDCRGFYQLGRRTARCWLETGHGRVNVLEGLVWSCDIVFYEMGRRLGLESLSKWAKNFGLGEATGIDLPEERKGFVPYAGYKEKYFKTPWMAGDSINYGIGQGFLLLTPLQAANAYALIAVNERYRPFLVKDILDYNQKSLQSFFPHKLTVPKIHPDNLAVIRQALRNVVRRGTGVAANVADLPAAGKTGTAENPGKAHAWFICYAPYQNPEIVIACFVEHGEHGDKVTARLAGKVLKWYKDNRFKGSVTPEAFERQYIDHGPINLL